MITQFYYQKYSPAGINKLNALYSRRRDLEAVVHKMLWKIRFEDIVTTGNDGGIRVRCWSSTELKWLHWKLIHQESIPTNDARATCPMINKCLFVLIFQMSISSLTPRVNAANGQVWNHSHWDYSHCVAGTIWPINSTQFCCALFLVITSFLLYLNNLSSSIFYPVMISNPMVLQLKIQQLWFVTCVAI